MKIFLNIIFRSIHQRNIGKYPRKVSYIENDYHHYLEQIYTHHLSMSSTHTLPLFPKSSTGMLHTKRINVSIILKGNVCRSPVNSSEGNIGRLAS